MNMKLHILLHMTCTYLQVELLGSCHTVTVFLIIICSVAYDYWHTLSWNLYYFQSVVKILLG